jgi:hypothetical protein
MIIGQHGSDFLGLKVDVMNSLNILLDRMNRPGGDSRRGFAPD